jgi:V8-like Glu-specific endopeptidase
VPKSSPSGHRSRRVWNVALGVVCASLLLGVSGCSQLKPFRVSVAEPAPTPASLPSSGEVKDESSPLPLELIQEDDYVVRVVAGQVTCTGTLIASDQVVTAHHCVTERTAAGGFSDHDVAPEQVRVELGGDYLPWGEIEVRAIVSPSCGYAAGEGDLAILVLDKKYKDMPTVQPRLDAPPELGERIEPIGFGRCARSSDGIRRSVRSGGQLQRLGSGRFRLEAAICPGDSGGPALSAKTGELIGVISASVMDGSEQTRGLSEFTRLDRWRSLFSNAKLVSEGAASAELPPIDCAPPGGKPSQKKLD